VNDRPIIGVLTEPLGVEVASAVAAKPGLRGTAWVSGVNYTYIAASYVKFAEAAGARVVPLHYDAPAQELRDLFAQINGIIFPGGGVDLKNTPGNKFRESAQLLYSLALEANDKGDVFPIHGTCLGFQLLTLLTAQDDTVECTACFAAEGEPLPLDFIGGFAGARSSKLFEAMSDPLLTALSTEKLTENSHANGFVQEVYETSANLRDFYTVLSTNLDYNGKRFVSTIEAKNYPITGTQWHPEKNNFEWGGAGTLGKKAIPHSAHAVELSQYMANIFVGHARMSSHLFISEAAEDMALIYNDSPGKDPQGYFTQVYLWDAAARDVRFARFAAERAAAAAPSTMQASGQPVEVYQ